ncbi:MAG: hypothetical protein WEA29_00755 [Acidimicrobiia bacterium]
MTDSQDRDALSSSEMIRRAKHDLSDAVENSEIDKIVSDLEDLEVAVPVAERYPEPMPRLDTGRPRRPQPVERRVPSSYDPKDDPFDRDDTPVRLRAAVFAALALLVIGVAVAVLFAAAS